MKTLILSAICLTPFLSIFLAAVLPETTHHVTTKHVTTTPRPTPERYEQTNNFYLYDRDSHYFCVSHHSIRVHYHYCLCYHLPYEHRGELNDPMLLLKTEKLMFELYDAGYYVQLPLKELEYYSHRNYAMCTHTNGNPPNTTFFMVYPKPDK
ncbi:uncharacterized protein LOC128184307 [Crassostrea angulata]|uniref:Uncharacterized protein n=1 Tax=Magallana gigas TaxID=29159 RepID=A0A8W8JAC7_MAGGI|nr:uncharacterized protein LOC117691227 [Crassostrea gigas]XP_052709702.1 uncharacterized protein LOC128184307 [Crassostrea angulata]|eukprot:XP_011454969.1 PREDICTED: uncharacterized protein LOC105347507 isoform X1 [Crassostrea gigas]